MSSVPANVNADASAEVPSRPLVRSKPRLADVIYRPFFIAGIAITLTLGAVWGALLLWRIGFAGSFTSVGIHEVNAHGEAQLFGWVGLFIMGFAYQVFPRMWQTRLPAPRLAVVALILMLTGLTLRTVGMVLADAWSLAVPVSMIGGGLQISAVIIFLAQMFLALERRRARFEPYMGFLMLALAWFGVSSVFSVWHTWTTMTAQSREDLLFFVSTFQAALRDTQIHGVALMMILGVSLKMLPAMFGWPRIDNHRAMAALFVLAIAVAGETSFFVGFRWNESMPMAGMVYAMWVLLAAGVAAIVLPWQPWRPMPRTDRNSKFIRAAYIWLGVSLVMLLLLPLYQILSGLPFSHAYYGAVRHAITVGFISMMIMGMGGKIIPALNGLAFRSLPSLWGPFALVNIGCFLRVFLQPLTDASPRVFSVIGISGTLEVIGLAWWGISMLAIMLRGRQDRTATAQQGKGALLISQQVVVACCSPCAGDEHDESLQDERAARSQYAAGTIGRSS